MEDKASLVKALEDACDVALWMSAFAPVGGAHKGQWVKQQEKLRVALEVLNAQHAAHAAQRTD